MRIFCIFILYFFVFFLSSLNAAPDEFEALLNQGNDFVHQGLWDRAIEVYEKAITINPEVAIVHYNLSLAYFYKHLELFDKNRALKLYDFFSKGKNENNKEVEVSDNLSLMQDLEKLQIEELMISIRLDNKNGMAHYFLGTYYYNNGNLIESEAHLKQAIQFEPDYLNSYGVLASVYEKMGNIGLAIECYKDVLKRDPENNDKRKNLILLYNKLGMANEAMDK